jgi:hypothetical protein
MCFIARAESKDTGNLGTASVVETTGTVLGVAEVVLGMTEVLWIVEVVLEGVEVILEVTTDEAVVVPPEATVDTGTGETAVGATVVHARPESALRTRTRTSTPIAARETTVRRRPDRSRHS